MLVRSNMHTQAGSMMNLPTHAQVYIKHVYIRTYIYTYPTYTLTNCLWSRDFSWERNSSSASQGSLPCSQQPATGSYPESDQCNPHLPTLFL